MRSKLFSLCLYVNGKVAVNTLDKTNYISTENMLPNKGGVERASVLPSVQYTQAYSKGDVLVSNIRPYFKKIWQAEFDGGCSNDVLVFRANGGCDPTFLYYVLANDAFFDYATATSKGTKMPRGDKTAIMQYVVPDFDKDTQKRISGLLRCLDKQIATNKKINDNLQQQAQAIYQSLFVSFDGIPTNQLIDSELGLMPVGWTVKSLSEVTTSIRTKVKDNDYKVLSAINTGQLQLSEEHFNKQVFSKNISNYIVVEPFDFAYNPARINIGSIGMNTLGLTGCVSPVYVVIRTEPGYHHFFDFFVKTKRFSEEVKTRASGSVRQSLNYVDFGQIKVAYPPIDAVERFNREYTVRLKIMEQLKTENEKLVSIRDSLLPKLMSGEIDVSDVKL